MVGPLFYHEMLLGSRRSRDYYFRWIYGAWLIAQLLWFAFTDQFLFWFMPPSQEYTNYVCRHFCEVFVPQHFILLALVTPAFVASAVAEEKTRGTLQYLLTTDLAPIHIIVGKLIGRILQVVTLALAGLPLFAMLGALGGVEPALLLGLLIVTVYVAAGVAAATFLAAVWTRNTRDAVLGLYAVGLVAATAMWWFGGPLDYFNPVYLLAPLFEYGGLEAFRVLGRQLFPGLLAWGGLTTACLGLAAWRLRPAYIRQLQGEGRPTRRRWWDLRRPPIGERPVRWKEQHVEGLAPVAWMRQIPRWLGILVCVLATLAGSCTILVLNFKTAVTWQGFLDMVTSARLMDLVQNIDWSGAGTGFLAQGSLALNVFGLLVAIRCSGAVTGERERASWEPLLLSPLTVEELIRGKLWGIMRVSFIYLTAYAVPALLLSILGGPIAVFWTVLYLGLTVLAMYYLGAVGLWSSVRARGSWRSLLTTILVAYLAAILLYIVLSPVLLIIGFVIFLVAMIVAQYLGLGANTITGAFGTFWIVFLLTTSIGLILLFWIAARLFLRGAQKWVADRERTRHWEDEPVRRRRRRRRSIVREV